VTGIHRRNGIVAPQPIVHRIGEADAVAVERAAETAAACHEELPVPFLSGQANVKISRGANEAQYAAV
jgi:hypothetical protein